MRIRPRAGRAERRERASRSVPGDLRAAGQGFLERCAKQQSNNVDFAHRPT
jgi:hypothetical protein